jgi:carbonic anhydrase
MAVPPRLSARSSLPLVVPILEVVNQPTRHLGTAAAVVVGLAGCGGSTQTATETVAVTETVQAPAITVTETSAVNLEECHPFAVGPAFFDEIVVVDVTCHQARRLLDRTTLVSVRRNRTNWVFRGWEWHFAERDEMSAEIEGKRDSATINAIFSVG